MHGRLRGQGAGRRGMIFRQKHHNRVRPRCRGRHRRLAAGAGRAFAGRGRTPEDAVTGWLRPVGKIVRSDSRKVLGKSSPRRWRDTHDVATSPGNAGREGWRSTAR
ncbi:hypothetical protein A33M_1012 [Rhodovulum sp. PH10]|nr:hypothetical protein A33M_1012 [Rhodovulum sp. PH10]